jgi:hypothetical protein
MPWRLVKGVEAGAIVDCRAEWFSRDGACRDVRLAARAFELSSFVVKCIVLLIKATV